MSRKTCWCPLHVRTPPRRCHPRPIGNRRASQSENRHAAGDYVSRWPTDRQLLRAAFIRRAGPQDRGRRQALACPVDRGLGQSRKTSSERGPRENRDSLVRIRGSASPSGRMRAATACGCTLTATNTNGILSLASPEGAVKAELTRTSFTRAILARFCDGLPQRENCRQPAGRRPARQLERRLPAVARQRIDGRPSLAGRAAPGGDLWTGLERRRSGPQLFGRACRPP